MTTIDISLSRIKHSTAMHLLVLRYQIPNSEMERANQLGWIFIDSNDDIGVFELAVAIEAEILRELDSK